MNSYFPMPYNDSNWTSPESFSVPLEDPTFPQCTFNDISGPPSLSSMHSIESTNCHEDLARITEGETWNLSPRPENTISDMEPHYHSAPSPIQKAKCTLPTREYAPRRRPSMKRAESDNSSETQTQQKRRMNFSGSHEKLPTPKDTGPSPKLEPIDTDCKAKPTAHSVIERRYRDSLNSRITQLDQTLFETRQCNNKAGSPVSNEDSPDAPCKTRKADVLNEAMRYVKQAELEKESRRKEIDFLRLRVAALEKLVMCGDCALLKQFSGQQIGLSTEF